MKLVLASRLGTAIEEVEAHLDFHLAAGVDVVVVESDSSVTIADRFARDPAVQVVHGSAAAAAVSAIGADWLIESEVNEFWWPRGGTLKELLEPLSPRYGSVQALPRHFVPVTDDSEPFSERMIHRLVRVKAEHRFVCRTARDDGRLNSVRGWFPIEVLRFPVNGPGDGYDDDALRRGVEEGVLTVDTRIRDALRALADGRAPDFVRADVVEEARFAADLAVLGDADIVQARDRLEELEGRLALLESSFTEVAKRQLRKLRSRW